MFEVCRECNLLIELSEVDGILDGESRLCILCHNTEMQNTIGIRKRFRNISIDIMTILESGQFANDLTIHKDLHGELIFTLLIETEPHHGFLEGHFQSINRRMILCDRIVIDIGILSKADIKVEYIMVCIQDNVFEETGITIDIIFQNIHQSIQGVSIRHIGFPSSITTHRFCILEIILDAVTNLFGHIILDRLLQGIIDTLESIICSILFFQILHVILNGIDEGGRHLIGIIDIHNEIVISSILNRVYIGIVERGNDIRSRRHNPSICIVCIVSEIIYRDRILSILQRNLEVSGLTQRSSEVHIPCTDDIDINDFRTRHQRGDIRLLQLEVLTSICTSDLMSQSHLHEISIHSFRITDECKIGIVIQCLIASIQIGTCEDTQRNTTLRYIETCRRSRCIMDIKIAGFLDIDLPVHIIHDHLFDRSFRKTIVIGEDHQEGILLTRNKIHLREELISNKEKKTSMVSLRILKGFRNGSHPIHKNRFQQHRSLIEVIQEGILNRS